MQHQINLKEKKWIVYPHYFLRKSSPPELSERMEVQLLY